MTAAVSPAVLVRVARESDLPFITNAWRESFANGSHSCTGAEPNHLRLELTVTIGRLLKGGTTLVAYDREDEDGVVGFACFSGPSKRLLPADLIGVELHYVYVRGGTKETTLRRMGIAQELLRDLPIKAYTFRTHAFEQRLRPRERGWAYTPRWTI